MTFYGYFNAAWIPTQKKRRLICIQHERLFPFMILLRPIEIFNSGAVVPTTHPLVACAEFKFGNNRCFLDGIDSSK